MENQPAQDAPGATPEAAKSAELAFRFPPIADKTLCFQLPSGDVWMGFNPAKFPRDVIRAWVCFQVEQYFALFMERIREAQHAAQHPPKKEHKSLRQILSGK
jgi:hypothetical protein